MAASKMVAAAARGSNVAAKIQQREKAKWRGGKRGISRNSNEQLTSTGVASGGDISLSSIERQRMAAYGASAERKSVTASINGGFDARQRKNGGGWQQQATAAASKMINRA
jgi:hypothetical protein